MNTFYEQVPSLEGCFRLLSKLVHFVKLRPMVATKIENKRPRAFFLRQPAPRAGTGSLGLIWRIKILPSRSYPKVVWRLALKHSRIARSSWNDPRCFRAGHEASRNGNNLLLTSSS